MAETISGVFAGVALDDLHLSVRGTSGVMAAVSALMVAVWSLVYCALRVRDTATGSSLSSMPYEPLGVGTPSMALEGRGSKLVGIATDGEASGGALNRRESLAE